jgi:DNA-3-methyladenine glycosylase
LKLKEPFFKKEALSLAESLLGKNIIRFLDEQKLVLRIVETEAYVGPEDKAAHSYENTRAERTKIMYHRGGHLYIYQIYGMYYCMNIVADREKPEAVLIRAGEPMEGIEIMKKNRKKEIQNSNEISNGPGKLCQALRIDLDLNGYDLCSGKEIYMEEGKEQNFEIVRTERVNIPYAEEYQKKKWRFFIKGNPFVSKM